MLKAFDLGQLVNPQKICYNTQKILKMHNPTIAKKSCKLFNQDSAEIQNSSKVIVPIKQYSNKFLRQSASKQNQKDRIPTKQNHFTSIVNKHKAYQRKYQKMLSKKHYICKTQPSENQYQCFTTAHNFGKSYEKTELEKARVKTDCMKQRHSNHTEADLRANEKEQQKDLLFITPFQQERVKVKKKPQPIKKQQKISTSRALQFFSRIVSKDKGDLLDRMKNNHESNLHKDMIMESSKNLQVKQIILSEKQKKYSFAQRGQKRVSLKTGFKHPKKKPSNIIKLFQQNQKFEVCGWDIDD